MYLGDFRLESTFDTKFCTVTTTGAPTQLAGSPVISAYVGNSTTQLTAGITLSVDFDSVTGLNNVRVVATAANGYATASNYQLVITTGTVGGTSVVGYVIGEFSLENRSAVMPTTAARTLDVSATGEAGVDWANVGSPTTAVNLSATNIDVDQIVASVSGAVGSVTGAVGSVTGAVGSVTGAVGSVAAGGITAATIANGAIDAATFAAGAIDAAAIADGAIDAATFAAGAINAAAIASDAITDAKVASDVTIASVTGAVGSVTGAVGSVTGAVGSVTGAVGSVGAGGITATSIATGAIDADALATDAVAEFWAQALTEPTAVPSATPTAIAALSWLLTLSRNKITQTSTAQILKADDGSTTIATSTVSDDATTFTRGEFA